MNDFTFDSFYTNFTQVILTQKEFPLNIDIEINCNLFSNLFIICLLHSICLNNNHGPKFVS